MPKLFFKVTRSFLAALILLFCVSSMAQASAGEIDAFTARFLGALQSIKDFANTRSTGQQQGDEKARLQTLADELREVTRSELVLHMDPDRFYAKTGGLHYSVVDEIRAAFASHFTPERTRDFISDLRLMDAAATSFGTDWHGVAGVYLTLLNEKYSDRENYLRMVRILARYGGACGSDNSSSHSFAEICIPNIGVQNFRREGLGAPALEWAREIVRVTEELKVTSPDIVLDGLITLAELELLHGSDVNAERAIRSAEAVLATHPDAGEFGLRVKSIQSRLNAGAAASESVDTDAALSAFENGEKRPVLQVAHVVRTANSGQASPSLQQRLDKALDLNGRFANLPGACRDWRTNIRLRREIAVIAPFFEYWKTFPDFDQFCRFFFERNLARKRALAYPMLDKLYATHDEFGILVSYFQQVHELAEAMDLLEYPLSASVLREYFLAKIATVQVAEGPPRAQFNATLSMPYMKTAVAGAEAAAGRRQPAQAIQYLARATALASADYASRWRQGRRGITSVTAELGPIVGHALVVALDLARDSKLANSPQLAEIAFRLAQLAQIGDVGLSVQAGLRRVAEDTGEGRQLLTEFEQAIVNAGHLDALITIYGSAVDDSLREALKAARERRASLAQEMRARMPFYSDFADISPLSLREVLGRLAEGEALVMIVPTGEATALLAVSSKRVALRRVELGRADIEERVTRLRAGLDPNRIDIEAPEIYDVRLAHELYRALIAPVEVVISQARHLHVIAGGALASLPLATLVTQTPPAKIVSFAGLADVAWLAKRYATTVLTSVPALRVRGERPAAPDGAERLAFLGVGDPDFVSNRHDADEPETGDVSLASLFRGAATDRLRLPAIPPLPETREEINKVSATLSAGARELRFGADASEEAVKALSSDGTLARYSIVYFATHGVLPGELDGVGEAGLVLTLPSSPSERDDGFLAASEISRLRLNADWVVLSACNTAGAAQAGGEALSGLTKAFLEAGAGSVLVSHWPVISDAAVELTTRTFAHLRDQANSDRASALQRAMLEVIEEGRDSYRAQPAYWAPFVLVGQAASRSPPPSAAGSPR